MKLLEFSLNPDVPLRVYLSFYAHTFSWHMSDAQALEYAQALQSRNKASIVRLQDVSRSNTMRTVRLLRKAYNEMIEMAHVPATFIALEVKVTARPPTGRPKPLKQLAPPEKNETTA